VLTHTIGHIYVYKATVALSGKAGAAKLGLQMKRHTLGANAKALKAMLTMYRVSKAAQGMEEAEQAKLMTKDMPVFLEGAWLISVIDVEGTLRHVCKKVLTDTSIPREQRKRRAVALKRLGEIFLEASSGEAGNGADGKPKTLRERLQEMMPPEFAAAAGAGGDGGEGDDDDDDDDDIEPNLDDLELDGVGGGGGGGFRQEPVSREALEAMSLSELKAVLAAQGLSTFGLIEKGDFVQAIILQNGEQGAGTNGATTNGAATNGATTSGAATNGAATNGAATNSAATNGATTNGATTNSNGTANGVVYEQQYAASAPSFEAGERVQIHGLVGRAELNGCFGVVESHNAASGRYAVALEQGGEAPIALKPTNLTSAPEYTNSRI
jgi:hypothetical protein